MLLKMIQIHYSASQPPDKKEIASSIILDGSISDVVDDLKITSLVDVANQP